MPVLKAKHVVSFSSEDEKHPADNMLKPETYYKWRCGTPGETSATIVLQLEKSSLITGIDIGNNGSAFVEVLVGRSSWSGGEDFKVLLAASTFMTPVDSKAGKEVSRVRMFGVEHLNSVVSAEKWDQLKIVCRQPYNTSETYGLSFVKLYTSASDEMKSTEQKSVNLGRFKLKSDSDEESGSTLSTGSFFQKRMNIQVEPAATPKMSMAASARSSDPSPRTINVFKPKEEDKISEHPKKISLSDDKRREVANALLQGSDTKPEKGSFSSHKNFIYGAGFNNPNYDSSESSKRKIEPKAEEKKTPEPPAKKLKDRQKALIPTPAIASTPVSAVESPERPKIKKPKLKIKKIAFNQILSGVVFALSGYQNPERSNIRDLALSMGAKYEASWSNRCTHLVCAFANTPKFKEVKGKGKIVTKKWFQECDLEKRRVNTKPFRIDGGGESSFESSGSETELKGVKSEKEEKSDKKSSSECDTEDEIERIRQLQRDDADESTPVSVPKEDDEVYDLSTDDEKEPENSKEKDPFPNFFQNKLFFLYGDFDLKDSKLLKRHITTYAGSVSDYMRETVNIVISGELWDTNFDHAYEENSALVFVQPKWIFKCHEKQMFVPYENYLIKRGDEK